MNKTDQTKPLLNYNSMTWACRFFSAISRKDVKTGQTQYNIISTGCFSTTRCIGLTSQKNWRLEDQWLWTWKDAKNKKLSTGSFYNNPKRHWKVTAYGQTVQNRRTNTTPKTQGVSQRGRALFQAIGATYSKQCFPSHLGLFTCHFPRLV